MGFNFLENKKGVHIKLTKEVHAELRAKLFKMNLSMQEVFDDFARMIAENDRAADQMLRRLVSKKITEEISTERKKVADERFSEPDAETLYDMINGIRIDGENT